MRLTKTSLFFSVMTICLFAGSVLAQSDDYYYDSEIKYSDQLKIGMEFTWEISEYDIVLPSEMLGLNQASTTATAVTSTTGETIYVTNTAPVTTSTTGETIYVTNTAPVTTSTTTYTSYETTTADTATTVYETSTANEYYPEFPDINPGTTITIKLLKDLSNMTSIYFSGGYDDYEEYQAYVDTFFEISYSAGTEEEMKDFIPAEALINPNTVVFENGTELNLYELQLIEYQQYQEEYNDDENNSLYEIKDGLAIRTESYGDPEYNQSSSFNIQYDIDTGLLVYVYSEEIEEELHFLIELKLKSSKGIDLNDLVANNDPTLSVPFSPIFVYTLILIPIVVNRIRKN